MRGGGVADPLSLAAGAALPPRKEDRKEPEDVEAAV